MIIGSPVDAAQSDLFNCSARRRVDALAHLQRLGFGQGEQVSSGMGSVLPLGEGQAAVGKHVITHVVAIIPRLRG